MLAYRTLKRINLAILVWLVTTANALAEPDELPLLNCRIVPHILVEVSSAVEGVIGDIFVEKNQQVKKGQKLVSLESEVEKVVVGLRKLQSEMESELKSNQTAFNYSQRKLKRIKGLYEEKAVSFHQMDEAKTETTIAAEQLQLAKDRKRQARLEYQLAIENLKRRTITSPIDGFVIERFKEPGEHVEDEPILQLAQLKPLRVEVFAPVAMYGAIDSGMKAEIIPELPNKRGVYKGEVVMVDKVVDAPSNTFGIRLTFPNRRQEIPSGLKCKVRFPDAKIKAESMMSDRASRLNSKENFSIELQADH